MGTLVFRAFEAEHGTELPENKNKNPINDLPQTQVKNSDSVDKGVDTPRGAGTGGVKVLGRKSVSVAPLDKYLRLKIQIYNIYIFRMSASLLTPKT